MKITHTSKDQTWINETSTHIPFNRTTPVERLHEKHSSRLLKEAVKLNKGLSDFKALIRDLSNEAYEAFMASVKVQKPAKGNFTWYNFNRTIKIEVSISEPIKFDEMTIAAAKVKLDEFLNLNIESKNAFAKDMAKAAFSTQRSGQLDVKKVLDLIRYKDQVNDPLFSESVELIQKAIRRPESKTYFRIWLKDETGKYNNIDLNLSSI
ncbi:DUF3164 family protein [Flavobacterium caeni]|uniref:DUF3164 family protein n=1 Tax=Flavobacterium caeni TaxID=490189 RepID=A0A1G5K2B7_9FLAO|nr:DUF3164 family protein [Flavobacterium caeni]SCY94361.1 Protein of unknown function [Flavobacterium caeni]